MLIELNKVQCTAAIEALIERHNELQATMVKLQKKLGKKRNQTPESVIKCMSMGALLRVNAETILALVCAYPDKQLRKELEYIATNTIQKMNELLGEHSTEVIFDEFNIFERN